jgi:hypothetical protein
LQSLWLDNLASVHSGKWLDWAYLEVCDPTHNVYGLVAHAVICTVISGASPLQDINVVHEGWRDQASTQPSPAVSPTRTRANSNT